MKKLTLITNTSYVVGCENDHHYLLKNGQVAFRGNEIVFVGRDYPAKPGEIDEIIDAKGGIVIPGLINLHCHVAASPVEKGFLEDLGSPTMYMTGLYEYLRVTHLAPEDQMNVLQFSLGDIMVRGSTTIFELGLGSPEMVEAIGQTGIRAYIGLMARAGVFMTKDGFKPYYEWDEPNAFKRLEETLRRRDQYDGSFDGRIHIGLYPGQVDTCTPDYLDEVARVMRDNPKMPLAIHAAQTINEYNRIVQLYGMTPAHFLAEHGIIGPQVQLGHYIMPCGHSLNRLKLKGELELLAKTGTNVIHCPWSYARRGMIMESLQKYLDLGINVALGTDTFTQDMIFEMKCAAVCCKIAENGDPFTGTAAEVFNAATIAGAKALGRDDLGRLQPGAKADIVIVRTDNFDCMPLRDPIKVLVYSASSHDIGRVIVDGQTLVQDGKVLRGDQEKMYHDMQKAGERMWKNVPNRDYKGRTADQISPFSFPLR
ncbi:MAG TPA: amidohydrolase family protein [Firmicutes bacterium]|nr:amidohydrolase family protein [Bacillota bacterium]